MCEPMKVAPYGADIISDYWQGRRYDGTEVKSIRSNPLTVLSYEIGHNEAYFFSLGFEFQPTEGALIPNGGIIVEFETPILNGVGDDLQIVEDTWGLPYPDETANVYVSNDATNWTYLGEADNQTPSSLYHTVSNFDLGSLTSARYVKVENTSVKENFSALYPAQKDTLDGYDLNAILALHDNQNCIIDSETAWADGTRFVPKGNWATFFNYPLEQDYELLETVFVPATSNVGIDSVNILVDGKQYILKASGFYKFANWTGYGYADAEYSHRAPAYRGLNYECDLDGWCNNKVTASLDVQVDGPQNWGDYNSSHLYELSFEGDGSTAHFYIYDDQYVDNVGGITVEIWEPMY